MAGVTDFAFRRLCLREGAALVTTEMVSARALCYHDEKTKSLLYIPADGHPCAAQLFGHEPEILAEAAPMALEISGADMLDLNMGCPMPKIVNNGEGSALMKDPVLVGRIVAAVKGASETAVTVKIRAGFDRVNAPEIAHAAAESGADMITVHARAREQYYEGPADWDVIAAVKAGVSVPVIGNGDVTGLDAAKEMIRRTGCDGVAIGRASRGNPWIFREIAGMEAYRPTADEKKAMMIRHLEMCIAEKGEFTGVREMRKHISWYTAGMPGSAKLRVRINTAESGSEMEDLIRSL
jgi:nifR3 family TIM-barrel protein